MIYLTQATIIPCKDNNLQEVKIHKMLNTDNHCYTTNLNEEQVQDIYKNNKIKQVNVDTTRINIYELIDTDLKTKTLFFNKVEGTTFLIHKLTSSMIKNNVTFYLKYETIDYYQGNIIESIDKIQNLFLKQFANEIDKNKHYYIEIYVDDDTKHERILFKWWLQEFSNNSLKILKNGLLINSYEKNNKWYIAEDLN